MAWELNSDRPIYSQILEKIQTRIICGIYRPGERLPSVRELAADAGVNPNTMQRALSELEHSGLIITQRNSGRTVTEDTHRIESAKREIAIAEIKAFFAGMRELGYSNAEILQLINEN
ncbi:MAG: GntR family transcriptional regulator [Roseburia sp.]|nr:GntR family transcriptional regulator [Roseburia sp.]